MIDSRNAGSAILKSTTRSEAKSYATLICPQYTPSTKTPTTLPDQAAWAKYTAQSDLSAILTVCHPRFATICRAQSLKHLATSTRTDAFPSLGDVDENTVPQVRIPAQLAAITAKTQQVAVLPANLARGSKLSAEDPRSGNPKSVPESQNRQGSKPAQ
jgi:hypothetical protein